MTEETPPGGYTMYGAANFLSASQEQASVEAFQDFELRGALGLALETLNHLWRRLVQRAQTGEIVVQAIKSGADAAGQLHPSLLLDGIADFSKHTLLSAGILYHAVRVFPSVGHQVAVEPRTVSATIAKSKGGNPGKLEDVFVQELIRKALTPDGFGSRREIQKHMEDWCLRKYGDKTPDERTLRRYMDRLLPPELPPK